MSMIRTRWAAIGAAVAITLGGSGIGLVSATVTSGDKPVLVPITPCRLVDTRPASQIGPRGTPLGTSDTLTISAHGAHGNCVLPTGALALSLNVTAIGATLPTFLTIWEAGEPMPTTSSLNPTPGQPATPNAVTTAVSTDGEFDVYNLQGDVHVLVDVNGYYADHAHDDRYYTRDEADAAFVSARPTDLHISAYELRSPADGTTWGLEADSWWHNAPTTNSECIVAPIEFPIGAEVSSLSVVYFVPFGNPSLFTRLVGSRDDVGAKATTTHVVTELSRPAPLTPNAASERLDLPLNGDPAVRDDHSYVVFLCSQGVIEIFGVDIAVT